jgi:hypothetical protein
MKGSTNGWDTVLALLPWALVLLFFILLLREIRAKIPFLKNINLSFLGGKGSAEFDTPNPQKQQILPDAPESLSRSLVDVLGKNDLVTPKEEQIRTFLADQNLVTHEDREIFLIRQYGNCLLHLEFESIFNRIYGSQLRGLSLLLTVDHLEWNRARELFYEGKAEEGSTIYPNVEFEPRLKFLLEAQLAEQNNSDLRITLKGRLFMAYLVVCGYIGLNRNG